jgi:amidase
MIRIGRDKTFGAFDKRSPPVVTVRPGDMLCLETEDSHDGTIRSEADRYYTEQFRPNPATGPVAVDGAEPGDALALEILEIRPGPVGYTTIRPTWGLITGVVDRSQAKILRVEGNEVVFAPEVRFPIRPMIGTIGTAPAGEPVSNMYAGPHGGNMDNNDVAPGATVLLPVSVPGGLFGLGDVHASMGDGELSGGGFDLPAEVTLRIGLRKGLRLRWPRIEREGHVITTGAHADPLEAMRIAVDEMASLLGERLGIDRPDALMLLSVRGDVKVCTCHNHPQAGHTTRVAFPKLWED